MASVQPLASQEPPPSHSLPSTLVVIGLLAKRIGCTRIGELPLDCALEPLPLHQLETDYHGVGIERPNREHALTRRRSASASSITPPSEESRPTSNAACGRSISSCLRQIRTPLIRSPSDARARSQVSDCAGVHPASAPSAPASPSYDDPRATCLRRRARQRL